MFDNDLQKRIVDMIVSDRVDSVKNNSQLSQEEKLEKALQDIFPMTKQYNVDCDTDNDRRQYVVSRVKEIIGYRENVLILEDGYQPWLEDVRTDVEWIHRDRYFKYLRDFKDWDNVTIKGAIDTTTDLILDHTANPSLNHNFTKKGLVVGDIQSGKTANYIGLINKAFDVGYQLIIVLAGVQNDLRSQTQERLDREVLGYETSKINSMQNGTRIGVGLLTEYVADIESLTSRGNSGDFKKRNGVQLFTNAGAKKVAIVKKNTTVLKNLYDEISSDINLVNGKFNVPVMIIDDEVDQASINTKKDPELDPTKINAHIRNLINICNKVAYIGYTATPFANIFIDSTAENESFGKDLFPKDFILYLPKPSGYCGVDEFFGTRDNTNTELVEIIDDYEEFGEFVNDDGEFKMTAGDELENLAGSLKKAIDDYIIASAIRRSRSQGPVHNGMMINITQYKTPATSMRELVESYIVDLQNEFLYDRDNSVMKYEQVYESRFRHISHEHKRDDSWESVKSELSNVFELLKVKLLNGDSRDVIDYTQSKQSQIIAIGGNKLSRGITLEGLMISYYLRDPRAYDTAFQMGRWFGYKQDYLDLCRIYTQENIISNFIHMMDATNELKEEIKEMNNKSLTPLDYGMKIKTHPTMLPTERNKMRNAINLKINLSGKRIETTRFSIRHNDDNYRLIDSVLRSLESNPKVTCTLEDGRVPVYRNCDVDTILHLLNSYIEGNDGYSKITNCRKYIESLSGDNEITNWTIAVSNLVNESNETIELAGHTINKAYRSCISELGNEIRVLTQPKDFKYFFEEKDLQEKFRDGDKDNRAEIRKYFTKEHGLLVIYCVDLGIGREEQKVLHEDVVGLGLWFPETDNGKALIEYTVNEVYMRKQYLE